MEEIIKYMERELEATMPVKGSHKLSEDPKWIKGRLYTLRRCIKKAKQINKGEYIYRIYRIMK